MAQITSDVLSALKSKLLSISSISITNRLIIMYRLWVAPYLCFELKSKNYRRVFQLTLVKTEATRAKHEWFLLFARANKESENKQSSAWSLFYLFESFGKVLHVSLLFKLRP